MKLVQQAPSFNGPSSLNLVINLISVNVFDEYTTKCVAFMLSWDIIVSNLDASSKINGFLGLEKKFMILIIDDNKCKIAESQIPDSKHEMNLKFVQSNCNNMHIKIMNHSNKISISNCRCIECRHIFVNTMRACHPNFYFINTEVS